MDEDRILWEAEQMNKGARIDHDSYNDLIESYAEESYVEPNEVDNYSEFLDEFRRIKSMNQTENSYTAQIRETVTSAWQKLWENS